MNELKTFKIDQKFSGTEDLYRYLIKNIKLIGESIGIQIQKPIEAKPFCVVGKEKITERSILFFATKTPFPENLSELIALAGAFNVDIIVYFLPNVNVALLEPLNWLQKICNDDTQFIVSEADF